jgi:hypothetical protein
MSTSYINKRREVVDFSITSAFERQSVKAVNEVTSAGDYDIFFSAKNTQLEIIDVGQKVRPDIFNHRIKSTLNLFAWTLNNSVDSIDCKFVLSPEDDIETGDPNGLEFSKIGYSVRHSSQHLPVPDPHFVAHISNPHKDNMSFSKKKPIAVFRGTDTSKQRVRISHKSLDNPSIDCAITNFLPRSNEESFFKGIDKNAIRAPFMNYEAQLNYKYILDIYGHAIAWDRPCWVIPSNSVLILVQPSLAESHPSRLWYSKFIENHHIAPIVSEASLLDNFRLTKVDRYLTLQQEWAPFIFSQETLLEYMKSFLFKYNSLYNE